MDPADLYALFANALDHAIELTRKLPEPEKRMIDLLVCQAAGVCCSEYHQRGARWPGSWPRNLR